MSDKKTLIFAHRGIPALIAENSLSSFRYTIEHHADGIEFDVHLTKDHIPVIMHDERVDRTSDGSGFIKDKTFAELRQIHLKDGQLIPSLKEFLELVNQQPIRLNLEFKTDMYHYKNIEKIVMDMVSRYDLKFPVIYSSFYLNSLRNCYAIDPTGQYCFLHSKYVHNPEHFMKVNHLAGLHLKHYQKLTGGMPQRIWTVDDPSEERKLLKKGVAGIFTNNFLQAGQVAAFFQ